MTEREWLESDFPQDMIKFLRDRADDRKLRLFACETLQLFIDTMIRGVPEREWRLPETETLQIAPRVAARFAEGLAGAEEMNAAWERAGRDFRTRRWLEYASCMTCHPDAWQAAEIVDDAIRYEKDEHVGAAKVNLNVPVPAALLPGEAGEIWRCNLIRDVFGNPFRPVTIDPSWLTWKGGAVVQLAQAIYTERAFDRLPILADALEEAGCTNSELLSHCRQGGNHIRGCWVIDLLLGKSAEARKELTEAEWLNSRSSADMLRFLRGRVSDRKLRLYACEAVRQYTVTAIDCYLERDLDLPDEENPSRDLLAVTARFADGQANWAEVEAAREEAWRYCGGSFGRQLKYAYWVASHPDVWEAAKRVDRALELAVNNLPPREEALGEPDFVAAFQEDWGNPWRCRVIRDIFGNPFHPVAIDPAWLTWSNGAVVKLAQAIYDQRDIRRMFELADLLEEAGCRDEAILQHCRLPERDVRGCWVIDRILSKD